VVDSPPEQFYNALHMTEKDVISVLKFIALVIIAAIPFIFWDKIESFATSHQWILFIVFPIVAIIITFCAILIFHLFKDDQWTGNRVATVALAFLYAIIGIIANFSIISSFVDSWHWAAWIIGMLCWAVFSFLSVVLFGKLFSE